jgi:hypothetical protein
MRHGACCRRPPEAGGLNGWPASSWRTAAGNAYVQGRPSTTRDANTSAYVAVGAYHHYLVIRDAAFLATLWPALRQRSISR